MAGLFIVLLGLAAAAPALPAENHQLFDVLSKIERAARQSNYAGTFIYQEGSQMRTSRIAHVWDGENEREKLEILDGAPREFIRNNNQVTAYISDSKTMRIETRMASDLFPSMSINKRSAVGRYYALGNGEIDRVAGLSARQWSLRPKDRWRYGYKVWTDQGSGLLLRMQTIDAGHRLVEQISFTQLNQLGFEAIPAARLAPSFTPTGAWRVERIRLLPAALPGWRVRWMPPGFHKIQQVKRLVSRENTPISVRKAAIAPDEGILSQIVYSDGVAGISIFIEMDGGNRQEGAAKQGAINIISKRYGQFWLTIVGEVPAVTIKQIAKSIQFKP